MPTAALYHSTQDYENNTPMSRSHLISSSSADDLVDGGLASINDAPNNHDIRDPSVPIVRVEEGQHPQHHQKQQQREVQNEQASLLWWNSNTQDQQPDQQQRKAWLQLMFGQVIALIAASQNMASYTMENELSIVVPLFLLWNCYVCLAMHLFFRKRQPHQSPSSFCCPHKAPLWQYMLILAMDIVPNFMVLCSLQYTSLTSATLLSTLTIPSAMLTCRWLMKKRFHLQHYVGAALCLVGGVCNVWSDYSTAESSTDTWTSVLATATMTGNSTSAISDDSADGSGSNPLLGDFLAIMASITYGAADAVGEYFVKNVDRYEYLGMLGLLGAITTSVLIPFLERDRLLSLTSQLDADIVGTSAWYVASVVAYYMSASYFMIQSDATLLNLSLQSSSLWAAVFSIIVVHEIPTLSFYVAILFVAVGVYLYEYADGNRDGDELTSSSGSSNNSSSIVDRDTAEQRLL